MRLKLISLGLAFCAWGYLRFGANPLITGGDRHVTVDLVTSGSQPATTVHLEQTSVSMTLENPVDSAALAAGVLSADVDLSRVPPGRHLVPVIVHSDADPVTELHPATVFVTITQGSHS